MAAMSTTSSPVTPGGPASSSSAPAPSMSPSYVSSSSTSAQTAAGSTPTQSAKRNNRSPGDPPSAKRQRTAPASAASSSSSSSTHASGPARPSGALVASASASADPRRWEADRQTDDPPSFFLGIHRDPDPKWSKLESEGSALQETEAYTLSIAQLRHLLALAGIAHTPVTKAQHPTGWTPKDQAVALILLHGVNKYGYCTLDPADFDPVSAFAEPSDDTTASASTDAPQTSSSSSTSSPPGSRETSAALAAVRQLTTATDRTTAAAQQPSNPQPSNMQPSAQPHAPPAHEQPLLFRPPQSRPPVADPVILDEWADRLLDGAVAFADLPPAFAAAIINRLPSRRSASAVAALPRPPPSREAASSLSTLPQSLLSASVGQGRWIGTEEKLPAAAADSKLIAATRQRLSLLASSTDTAARPDIQTSVVNAAIAGQHVNIALFRPRSDTSLPEQSLSFMIANDDGTLAQMPVGASRKTTAVSSFIDWTQCYLEYERIVTAVIPEAVHLTRAYFKLIAYLAVLNAPAAIRYDNAHRKHLERAAWPSNYAARLDSVWLDSTMHASAAASASPAVAPSSAPTFSRARVREPRSTAAHAPAPSAPAPSTCRNWNNGVLCNPQFVDANNRCRFAHACAGCGSDAHKQSDCPTRPTSAIPRGGRGRGGRGRGRNVTRHF